MPVEQTSQVLASVHSWQFVCKVEQATQPSGVPVKSQYSLSLQQCSPNGLYPEEHVLHTPALAQV